MEVPDKLQEGEGGVGGAQMHKMEPLGLGCDQHIVGGLVF